MLRRTPRDRNPIDCAPVVRLLIAPPTGASWVEYRYQSSITFGRARGCDILLPTRGARPAYLEILPFRPARLHLSGEDEVLLQHRPAAEGPVLDGDELQIAGHRISVTYPLHDASFEARWTLRITQADRRVLGLALHRPQYTLGFGGLQPRESQLFAWRGRAMRDPVAQFVFSEEGWFLRPDEEWRRWARLFQTPAETRLLGGEGTFLGLYRLYVARCWPAVLFQREPLRLTGRLCSPAGPVVVQARTSSFAGMRTRHAILLTPEGSRVHLWVPEDESIYHGRPRAPSHEQERAALWEALPALVPHARTVEEPSLRGSLLRDGEEVVCEGLPLDARFSDTGGMRQAPERAVSALLLTQIWRASDSPPRRWWAWLRKWWR